MPILTGQEFSPGDNYATHQPLLLHALDITMDLGAAVVEFGSGYMSTPLLHHMCREQNRNLYTLESDPEWLARFIPYRREARPDRIGSHVIEHVENYLTGCDWIWNKYFDVALVDNMPEESRKHIVEKLADRCRVIVIHDSEEDGYNYEPVFAKFKYRMDYNELFPWSTMVSNTIDFSHIK